MQSAKICLSLATLVLGGGGALNSAAGAQATSETQCLISPTSPRSGFPRDFSLCWWGDIHVGQVRSIELLEDPRSYGPKRIHRCQAHGSGISTMQVLIKDYRIYDELPYFLVHRGRLYLVLGGRLDPEQVRTVIAAALHRAESIWEHCHGQIRSRESYDGWDKVFDGEVGRCGFSEPAARADSNSGRANDHLWATDLPPLVDAAGQEDAEKPFAKYARFGLNETELQILGKAERRHLWSVESDAITRLLHIIAPAVVTGLGPEGRGILRPEVSNTPELQAVTDNLISELQHRNKSKAQYFTPAEVPAGYLEIYCYDSQVGSYMFKARVTEEQGPSVDPNCSTVYPTSAPHHKYFP